MKAKLEALRDVLAEAVVGAECEVSGVLVTAGRPAAPSEEGRECQTVIYVFGALVTDENQGDFDSCIVRTRWNMSYEIHTCYPEDWYDQVGSEDAEEAADCLYELMALVWCAVVQARDDKVFGECANADLQPLTVLNRLGGAVSALGGVSVPYNCPVETSPTSP